jgi:hypothetical protein
MKTRNNSANTIDFNGDFFKLADRTKIKQARRSLV